MSQPSNITGDMDPFDARLYFISVLKKVNASQQSIQSCTTFALRHNKYYEDLYRCIMEVMQKATIASRMNLFYFLDSLCAKSKKADFTKYLEYIQRDLKKIVVDLVCERDEGCFNLINTLKVLKSWKEKNYIEISVIENAEKFLLEWKGEKNYPPRLKLPKTDIIKRIEEDRERAKHHREDIWWVDKSHEDGEAVRLWEECSELSDSDYQEILTENCKYKPNHPWLDDYNKVKLWNEEQKRLEEEEEKERLRLRKRKLIEEEKERQRLIEEERERQRLIEEERERQRLIEEEKERQRLIEEENERQRLIEEEKARQRKIREEKSIEEKPKYYGDNFPCITNFDQTSQEFDDRNINYDPSFIYSFPISNNTNQIIYEQPSFYNQSTDITTTNNDTEPSRENETSSLLEEYHVEQIAGSNLGLLMQAVGLLEAGVSSLPDD
ncbi:5484_t:CDS:1 [Diversispora eburnea]|uniref:5484_t:CDS:1 n=1 Tax=Diversispora eburnea TaxID=1213867 RepID=A0A9N9FVU9_9GLOM|nr:5484_t:CDS:1 [Diversispora eburnea]